MLAQIIVIHLESRRINGPLRICNTHRDRGAVCGRNRVACLMRKHDIPVTQKRCFKVTADSGHGLSVCRQRAESTVWRAYVSFIPTRQGSLYLAVVLDLFSRRVVGWSMSGRNDHKLVTSVLKMALNARRPKQLLHHSDRGSTYASGNYQVLLGQ